MSPRSDQFANPAQGSIGAKGGITKWTYAGLFMVSLATLMFEILLTRIFSVTMWYHFAFMAISLAMLGMTVGAVWVYVRAPDAGPAETKDKMVRSSLLFAIWTVVGFLIHTIIPFIAGRSFAALASMVVTYTVISIPFVFSGICVCLALTRYPRHVSKLYAVDLAGAASGCVLLVYAIKITDGPSAVIFVASLASMGAVFFSLDGGFKELRRIAATGSVLFAAFGVINTVLAKNQHSLLPLAWTKGWRDPPALYEKWNSFSRITVSDEPERREKPFGFGLSSTYASDRKLRQLFLKIDASAETVLTGFDGHWDELEHLKYDITNLVHYIRPDSRVLVVGAGGGRDVLSALAFGQKSVLAVEINEDIIRAVNKRFGDFTGHLDRNPRVTFVNDEARSYIARSRDQFDIIQVSFIDTWAATAAGAFVLTENSLYTMEAWRVLLEHLTPSGVLSISRWYFRYFPSEMYRATSLAGASLAQLGIHDPEKHIVIIKCLSGQGHELEVVPHGDAENARGKNFEHFAVGTILVGKKPFPDEDLDRIEEVAKRLQFEIVFGPRFSVDSTFSNLTSGRGLEKSAASLPIDLSPPTDDRPFFFNMLRLRDAWNPANWNAGISGINLQAVFVLGALLVTVIALSALSIIVPLALTTRRETLRGATPHLIFFAAIGLGFMFIEISQMQRMIVFLGHPTYSLSVLLFALLLSSGLGSYTTQRFSNPASLRLAITPLLLLLVLLIIFGIVTPHALHSFQASTTIQRILAAVAILSPLGLTMGMAFPLGLKLAARQSNAITPWLWGINGAASVCASVLAVAIAMNAGISAAFWTGFGCYTIAFGAFASASRGGRRPPASRLDEHRDAASNLHEKT